MSTNWALGLQRGPSAGEAYQQAYQNGMALRNAREDRAHLLAERNRVSDARDARAAYLLSGLSGTSARPEQSNALLQGADSLPQTPQPTSNALAAALRGEVAPGPTGLGSAAPQPAPVTPPRSARDEAFARFVKLDPEGAASVTREEATTAFQRLRNYETLNNLSLQILAGVSDQASYERGREQARHLMIRFGEDPSGIDQLPAQWSPQVSETLRMQGMSTARQLTGMLQRARLEWDIEDDQTDNEALADYRGETLRLRERGQNIGSADRRRGQNMADARGRRGQDMADERARNRDDGGSWFGGGRRSRRRGGAEATATGPGGQRIFLRGGQWVDANGQPVG